jgi:2-polyprenyl-3-methyl-5-hydroxy-6-metoxy-1,4-benzoquinol methylase
MLKSLGQRHREDEVMDQPGLDSAEHAHALRGLARINAWSGSARILWPALAALARQLEPETVRVLDLATGGGDVPLRLWRRARRARLQVELAGCDCSPIAVMHARHHAAAAGAPVNFFVHDVLADALPQGYHVLTSSLFLHHLERLDALKLLQSMRQAAGQLVLVNDLRRSGAAWLLAYAATRVLTRSPVVHVDGPRSVAAAFTCAEAAALAHQAGLGDATVARRWPFRFLLNWRRPDAVKVGA